MDATTGAGLAGGGSSGAEESDEMLAIEAARGRKEALAKLFERHAGPLYDFIARMIGDASYAEDIVHDIFVALPSKAGSFDGRSKFSTWLYAVAVNAARMHLRRKVARRELPLDAATGRSAGGGDPAAEAEKRETIRKVREAITKLTEAEREAFLLYWRGGLGYEDIARVLDINVTAAKVRVHRAHVRIADLLGT